MNFFHKIVNQQLNTITARELLGLAKKYGIKITEEEAKKVAQFLKGKNYNIFNSKERKFIIQKIGDICGTKTAKEVEKLIEKF